MKAMWWTGWLLGMGMMLSPAVRGTDRQAAEVARKVDELYRSQTSRAELSMTIETPHWRRTLRMRVWSKGMQYTFIRILEPKKERGVGTLRVGTDMWNYLPRTGKTIKVPPSMMMASWMGSDFTNDDLVREYTLLDDYTFRLVPPPGGTDGKGLLYLEARPKPNVPIVWDRVVIVVRSRDLIPVRQEYYDDTGAVTRTLTFTDITTFNGRRVPATLTLVPADKSGRRTVIHYHQLAFDVPVSSDAFSLRHLRRPEMEIGR